MPSRSQAQDGSRRCSRFTLRLCPDKPVRGWRKRVSFWGPEAPNLTSYLTSHLALFHFFFLNFLKCLFILERETGQVGQGQRERESQNRKQAPGSELSAQSWMRGSNSQAMRSRPEPKLDAQLTEPPRHPIAPFYLLKATLKGQLRKTSLLDWHEN